MSNFRNVSGFVTRAPLVSQNTGDAVLHVVDFVPALARTVLIPGSVLEEAGLIFGGSEDPGTEGLISAEVDLAADELTYLENVRNITFKGWLPGLDEPFYLGSE